MAVTGNLINLKWTSHGLELQWEIKDFFSLSENSYKSPTIYFSDALWYLCIYPSGQRLSEEYVGIFLTRHDSGPAKCVTVKIFLQTVNVTVREMVNYEKSFGKNTSMSWGARSCLIKDLVEKKSELVPSGVLTLNFHISRRYSNNNDASLIPRLLNSSNAMGQILKDGNRSDVVLKVDKQEFPVHKMILEARSSVFAAMFKHDTEEEKTGVVNIIDVHPKGLKIALSYIYTGVVSDLNFRNVFHTYKAADKYLLTELLDACKTFLKDYMCEEEVCNIISLADSYDEEELSRDARAYFTKHLKKIVKMKCWETFYKENQKFSMDLIIAAIDERVVD